MCADTQDEHCLHVGPILDLVLRTKTGEYSSFSKRVGDLFKIIDDKSDSTSRPASTMSVSTKAASTKAPSTNGAGMSTSSLVAAAPELPNCGRSSLVSL